jgi:hypothetical protein
MRIVTLVVVAYAALLSLLLTSVVCSRSRSSMTIVDGPPPPPQIDDVIALMTRIAEELTAVQGGQPPSTDFGQVDFGAVTADIASTGNAMQTQIFTQLFYVYITRAPGNVAVRDVCKRLAPHAPVASAASTADNLFAAKAIYSLLCATLPNPAAYSSNKDARALVGYVDAISPFFKLVSEYLTFLNGPVRRLYLTDRRAFDGLRLMLATPSGSADAAVAQLVKDMDTIVLQHRVGCALSKKQPLVTPNDMLTVDELKAKVVDGRPAAAQTWAMLEQLQSHGRTPLFEGYLDDVRRFLVERPAKFRDFQRIIGAAAASKRALPFQPETARLVAEVEKIRQEFSQGCAGGKPSSSS